MHAHELVELAAVIAAHGPALVDTPGRIPDDGIQEYWIASKSRLDRWARTLKDFSAGPTGAGRPWPSSHWPRFRVVFEEVITGDVLARVWTAVAHAYDQCRGTDQAEPIARSVLAGHGEARHRVLTLLVQTPRIDVEEGVRLNRLRRRTERWTDMLIGYLSDLDDVRQFAFQPHRARQFGEDLHCRARLQGGRVVWPLVLASLRAAFPPECSSASPNGDLNARIAEGILACLQPDLLDPTGLVPATWLSRLEYVTDDATRMIDDLLAAEGA